MTYGIAIIIGALAERLRGGWPPIGPSGSDHGAGVARLLRSTTLSLLIYALGEPWWVAAACFPTLWLGICIGSHSDCWRVENSEQFLDMALLGVTRGVFGLAPLFCWAGLERNILLPVVFMLVLPVAHATSYGLAAHHDKQLPRWGGILDDWNAYAELLWGACLASSVILLVRGG
jgi:hypothetical protein